LKNLILKILGSISLTSVLFVFQACYGTPQDMEQDNQLEGVVKSKASGNVIKGIKVSTNFEGRQSYTSENGEFSIFLPLADEYKLTFEDVDSIVNGAFTKYDTVITDVPGYVHLDILLQPK